MSRATVPSPAGGLEVRVALDALLRRNALARPEAPALADPPDRANFTDGAPRTLGYGEADAAVDRLARRLRSFGLPDRAVVAIQLPNTVEAVIALLAVLRAGMIATPVPVLWRRSDLVAALGRVDAKALVTMARLGEERPAEAACEAAVDLFGLSFPCAFGNNVPDGVVPLELETKSLAGLPDPFPAPAPMPDSEGVAVAAFDAAPHGFFAVGRSHAELLAAGLGTLLEAKIEARDTIVSTLPPASLAGFAAALVPWLLSGGALQLVHGHAPDALARLKKPGRTHLVAPAAALAGIAWRNREAYASCIAAHRAPATRAIDFSALACENIVDLTAFGETGAVALRREDAASAKPIPLGIIKAQAGNPAAPAIIETRLADDVLLLRGAMVPAKPFPGRAPAEAPQLEIDRDGFVNTGCRCRPDRKGGLAIETGPEGIATVGGLRFGLDDLAARVAKAAGGAKVEVMADALLGERLVIEAEDPAQASEALKAAGHSSLVIEAVRRSDATRRTG